MPDSTNDEQELDLILDKIGLGTNTDTRDFAKQLIHQHTEQLRIEAKRQELLLVPTHPDANLVEYIEKRRYELAQLTTNHKGDEL